MSDLYGFMNALKPVGCTSHDVVEMIRHCAGGVKTGHAGTLDPCASGVLVVMLGAATRLSRYMVASDKRYRAEFTLGIRTDTYDNEGRVVSRKPVQTVSDIDVRQQLAAMTGCLKMTPPPYSAVRVDGRRSYELARAGESAELEPRTVRIYGADPVAYHPGVHPRVLVDIKCSSGTYIRSIAQMLGDRLGTGAFMSGLVRMGVGSFDIDKACSLPSIEHDGVREHLVAPEAALDMPDHQVSGDELERARHGNRVYCDVGESDSRYHMMVSASGLVGIAEIKRDERGTYLQPRTVLPTGDNTCE